MNQYNIKPYDVITNSDLPELTVDQLPEDGDAVEINGELYFVCENIPKNDDSAKIGVIPLVVRNPAGVPNIKKYLDCLAMAHRRVLFKNSNGTCGLEACDEMVIL